MNYDSHIRPSFGVIRYSAHPLLLFPFATLESIPILLSRNEYKNEERLPN